MCLRIALVCLDFDRPHQLRFCNNALLGYFCVAQVFNMIALPYSILLGYNKNFLYELSVFVVDLIVVIAAQWKQNMDLSTLMQKT